MYENRFGRFTAVDSLLASGKSANPQTFNRYTYTGNNPVNFTDPTGLTFCEDNTTHLIAWNGEVKKPCATGSTSVDNQTIGPLGPNSGGYDSYGNQITPGSTVYFDESGETRVINPAPQNQPAVQGQSVAHATHDTAQGNAGEAASHAAASAPATDGVTLLPSGPPVVFGSLLPCFSLEDCGAKSSEPQSLDMSRVEEPETVKTIINLAEDCTLIPGLGAPCGIIAGVGRAFEGDLKDAGLDIATAIPFGAVLGKVAKTAKVAEEVAEGTHIVYEGINTATGLVEYVGITSRDLIIREAEHKASGTARALLDYRAVKGAEGLTKMQARVWEQNLINQYGLGKNGGQLLNKINSIAEKYWAELGIRK